MRLLYPSDPLDPRRPDENYQGEYDAARAAGIPCSLFSAEGFDAGEFHPTPRFDDGDQVLYRGWMLSPEDYARLCAAVNYNGATSVTSPEAYAHCHYLPNWYESCKEFTPETVILARDANFTAELAHLDWPRYFVKDYVKSLTTSRGSVAETPADVAEVVDQIEKFRGKIDGGICVRRFEQLLPETEERYFVIRGKAFGRDGVVPQMVHTLAAMVPSPFFAADVLSSRDGTLRLIELGDGQVSDRKKWTASQLVDVLRAGD